MNTYKATNTRNGKFYIGSTKNFEKRKQGHLKSRVNYPFQNALRQDPEAFEWEVWSDECEDPVLEQALLDMWFGKEQCYNLNPSAKHPPSRLGTVATEDTKKKLSLMRKGKLNHMHGRTGELNPMWGKTRPDLTKINSERTGELHPMFGRTGELNPMYGITGELHPSYGKKRPDVSERNSKRVEVIYPSGARQEFSSISEAAKFLECDRSYLAKLIKQNTTSCTGRFAGFTLRCPQGR